MSKIKNQLTIEKLEEFTEIPPSFFKEKNLHLVTALSTEEVLRRQVALKLSRETAVMKALPFQLETLLPLPPEETVVHPCFFPLEEGTDVVVFATWRQALKHHIEKMQERGIDPDQVSCVPVALGRWARMMFPHHKCVSLIHENTAVALEGDKIVFSQFLEDGHRLEAFLKNKFGHSFIISAEGPDLQDFPYEKLREFALPIGLALEGFQKNPCQFRQGDFQSLKTARHRQFLLRGALAAALSLAAVVASAGGWILHGREQALQEKIAVYFSAPQMPLEEKITAWQKNISQEAQEFLLLPDVPSVQETLAWIGGLQEPVEVVQFHYSLVQYPKAGEKSEPYSVKVDLEFKAKSPAIAHRFHEAVEKVPTLADKTQKIAWTAQQDSYKLSFYLRKI